MADLPLPMYSFINALKKTEIFPAVATTSTAELTNEATIDEVFVLPVISSFVSAPLFGAKKTTLDLYI